MKKKILAITILALALCMAIAFVRPVMAADTCTSENCAEGCEGGENCTAECCPVQIGDKCYPTLADAVTAAENDAIITLRADVELAGHVGVASKTITIKGNGHTIQPNETWAKNEDMSGDQSLITATGSGAKVTLENVTLANSKKYGAQAFNGGELVLNDVTVYDCAYGGILANGGTVTVKDLTLGKNGTGNNNGIEIAKQKSEYAEPKLVMDGTLTSETTENVIWIATNDSLDKFDVENTENSTDKVYVNGNTVVVADENGEILYTSNENAKVKPESTGSSAKTIYVVTVIYNGEKVSAVAEEGKTLADVLDVDAIKDAVEGKTFIKFVKDDGTDYDESEKISGNLTLTAVYEDVIETPEQTPETPVDEAEEKDPTPKTGAIDVALVASVVAMISVAGIVTVKKYSK